MKVDVPGRGAVDIRGVANTLGAAVMGLEEWLRALEPAAVERSEEASGQ